MNVSVSVVWANALVSTALYLGTGYAVFGLGHSPWWFLAAFVVSLAETQSVKLSKVGDASHSEAGR